MLEHESGSFIWSLEKERGNIQKHGVDFITASQAFFDPRRKIFVDSRHSRDEERYFCIAKVGANILTVRFTYRDRKIRIIGAGYWRKGVKHYDQESG